MTKSGTKYRPAFVVVDVETRDNDGASTDHWREDFRVMSMAVSWFAEDGSIKSDFMRGENAIDFYLDRLASYGIPLVAHNVQFEAGVFASRFPQCASRLSWLADTMRLVQCYDNGGDKFALEAPINEDDALDALEGDYEGDGETPVEDEKHVLTGGLGLSRAIHRILRLPDHKRPFYKWLRENVDECRAGREGQYLDRLPPDLLRAYNVADTENTLKLYQFLVDYFAQIGYNWHLDHTLYLSSTRLIVQAKNRGVAVNRAKLEAYRHDVEHEIESIARDFLDRFKPEIARVERDRLLARIRKLKKLKGRRNYIKRLRGGHATAVKEVRFNVGSNKQLAALFCGVLAIQPRFETATGAPSFRSAVLGQWGEGGDMLKKRRKRLLVLKQVEALLELSRIDGRFHIDLKSAGTATGRFAGGSHV